MVDASRGILAGSRSAIVQARSEFGNHIPWVKGIVAAGRCVGVGGVRVCKTRKRKASHFHAGSVAGGCVGVCVCVKLAGAMQAI